MATTQRGYTKFEVEIENVFSPFKVPIISLDGKTEYKNLYNILQYPIKSYMILKYNDKDYFAVFRGIVTEEGRTKVVFSIRDNNPNYKSKWRANTLSFTN